MQLFKQLTVSQSGASVFLYWRKGEKNIAIFDSLIEQVWLGFSLVALLIQLYSQIDTVSTPVGRQ